MDHTEGMAARIIFSSADNSVKTLIPSGEFIITLIFLYRKPDCAGNGPLYRPFLYNAGWV